MRESAARQMSLLVGAAGAAAARAAQAKAASVGTTVYTIDFAALIGTYAGEAAPRLDLLLAEAERAGAVLLVDEADALFGKRTEVKDSHDRYANLDAGALLARIEAYRGVVLFATSRRSGITAATTRRLRVVDSGPE